MTITVEIPPEIAAVFPGDLSRTLLESLVLEAYRESRIGDAEAAQALELSRLQWNHLLKVKNIAENAYTVEDLDRDVATIQKLRAAGALPAA